MFYPDDEEWLVEYIVRHEDLPNGKTRFLAHFKGRRQICLFLIVGWREADREWITHPTPLLLREYRKGLESKDLPLPRAWLKGSPQSEEGQQRESSEEASSEESVGEKNSEASSRSDLSSSQDDEGEAKSDNGLQIFEDEEEDEAFSHDFTNCKSMKSKRKRDDSDSDDNPRTKKSKKVGTFSLFGINLTIG